MKSANPPHIATRRRASRAALAAVMAFGLAVAVPVGAQTQQSPTSTVGKGVWLQVSLTGNNPWGSALWSGSSSSTPGTPAASGQCSPAIQSTIGTGLAGGYQNLMNISKQERTPQKILSQCIGGIIKLVDALGVWSKTGSMGFDAIMSGIQNAALQYAATAACAAVQTEYNALVNEAFNSMAFLTQNIPCGVGVSLPGTGGAGGLPGLCQAVGGPLVNVGAVGGNVYTVGGQGAATVLGNAVPASGSNPVNSSLSQFLSH